jgi:hypothetical protein
MPCTSMAGSGERLMLCAAAVRQPWVGMWMHVISVGMYASGITAYLP